MPQIFRRSANTVSKPSLAGLLILAGGLIFAAVPVGRSSIQDGEALTACQFACPTEAIVFGDSNDPDSRVAQLKQSPLNYALLADLNTRPRTTYFAIVRNPNTELEPPGSRTVGGEGH